MARTYNLAVYDDRYSDYYINEDFNGHLSIVSTKSSSGGRELTEIPSSKGNYYNIRDGRTVIAQFTQDDLRRISKIISARVTKTTQPQKTTQQITQLDLFDANQFDLIDLSRGLLASKVTVDEITKILSGEEVTEEEICKNYRIIPHDFGIPKASVKVERRVTVSV